MSRFEIIKDYIDKNITLPTRATSKSAGYDICAAKDCIIPSYFNLIQDFKDEQSVFTLDYHSKIIKAYGLKPTMVETGIKVQLADNEELELRSRSSISTKNLLMLVNGVGTIDADYYNNINNEGHIMIPLINFSPFAVCIKKGDRIAQGLIKQYNVVDDDMAIGERQGGFGSSGIK